MSNLDAAIKDEPKPALFGPTAGRQGPVFHTRLLWGGCQLWILPLMGYYTLNAMAECVVGRLYNEP